MRAAWCSSIPPAQIAKYWFNITGRSPEAVSRSKYVSVSVRVSPSEDLEISFFLYHFFDDEFELLFHLANRPNLATASWKSVAVWKYFFPTKNALDAKLLLLANRDAWWWQQFLFHLLLFASSNTCFTNVHVLLRWRRVLFFLVLLQGGPILSLFLPFFIVTKLYSIPVVFQISPENVAVLLFSHSTFEMLTSVVIQLEVFDATNCFPFQLFKQMRLL